MPASLNIQSFLDGRPAGVTNVVRDASGRLVAWVENGLACQVVRNAAGLPVTLTATANTERLQQAFTYDSAGRLMGMTGDAIPTVFASELADPQPGVQALVTGAGNLATSRAALAADNGATLELADGVTYTLTDAVALPAGVVLMGPASGSATIAVTGTATINGGTSSITIAAGEVYSAIPRATSAVAFVVKGG